MECNTCSGRGFISKQVPRRYKQRGVVVTLGNLTQTHSVFCPTCDGSGRGVDPNHDPACGQCSGTGWRNAWDSHGEYELEPCLCKRVEVAS